MKVFRGSFIKKDGSERTMTFSYLEDLPEEYLADRIIGSGPDKQYPPGMKLVWDLEEDNFRIFNFNAVLEQPVEIDY
jgi:hypothetical protein